MLFLSSLTSRRRDRALCDLASLSGLLVEYEDWKQVRQQASTEAMLAVLRALGIEIESPDEADSVYRVERRRHWQRLLAPCGVAWDGVGHLELRVAASLSATYAGTARSETGDELSFAGRISELPVCAA